jgi:hypothetical protein
LLLLWYGEQKAWEKFSEYVDNSYSSKLLLQPGQAAAGMKWSSQAVNSWDQQQPV